MSANVVAEACLGLESRDARKALAVFALSWLAWDSILLLRREYESIWKRECSVVKCVYLCSRYLGLIEQAINAFWTLTFLSDDHIPPHICRAWFVHQIVAIDILYAALELILMLRVYALYDCGKLVGLCLSFLWVFEVAILTILGVGIGTRSFQFHSACLIEKTPPQILFVTGLIVVVQLIVWGMTFFKTCNFGPGRSPLMDIVTRDGAIACVSFLVFFASVLPYTFFVHVLTHSMFAIFISLISIMTCRIVLNMQDLKSHQQNHSSEFSVAGISLWYLDTTFDTTDEGLDESLVNKESKDTESQS